MMTTFDDAQGVTFPTGKPACRSLDERIGSNLAITCLLERSVCIDLSAVTDIDMQGFAMLTLMARHGAVIVSDGRLNQDLVEEIRFSQRSES